MDFYGCEWNAGAFGFDHADGGAIHIQEIVGETVAFFQGVFADGYALGGGQLRLVAPLDGPSGGGEQLVDFGSGFLLRLHFVKSHHSWFSKYTTTAGTVSATDSHRDVMMLLCGPPSTLPLRRGVWLTRSLESETRALEKWLASSFSVQPAPQQRIQPTRPRAFPCLPQARRSRPRMSRRCLTRIVNIQIALTNVDHISYERATAWVQRTGGLFATCPITQGALIRFMLRAEAGTTIQEAKHFLAEVVALKGHEFWPAAISHQRLPEAGVIGHKQVTDACLVALARHNKGRLATLDRTLAALHASQVVLAG